MPDQKPNRQQGGSDGKGQRPPQGSNQGGPGQNNNQGPTPPQPPNRFNRNVFGWIMILGLGLLVVILITNAQNQAADVENWAEFENLVESYQETRDQGEGAAKGIKQIVIEDSQIVGVLTEASAEEKGADRVVYKLTSRSEYPTDWCYRNADELTKDNPSSQWLIMFLQLLPWLLIFGLIWFFLFRAMRGGGGGMGMLGNFGRSKHKVVNKEMTDLSLDDVAGVEEAKDEVQEIIEFLKHPKKFQRLGGRIPRGVLLIGQPGCGKTLLAKAVAGEAEVPFFSISGSDFVEMFVGVGASRVRDLFKQAKESSPCIIFLDEIDAVGRRRGGGFTTGGHDEREQTLNAILVEMDGFETNDQVIVMAATNRADVLDPALTRPGRFDRQINVPLPDIKGRLEILRVHARKVRMSPNIDMEKLAKQTPMFSGADLAAIINEAAIIATLGNKDFVEMNDLEEARDKVKFGRAKKSRKVEEEERIGTAYHEAGHAIINLLVPECDPLHKVTIIPRGQAMGATFSLPDKDRYGYGKNFVKAEVQRLCGGRIAEGRQTGDVTSGAAMDIRMATQYARHMVLEWGMSDRLGFVDYSGDDNPNHIMPEKGYSDETARAIDEEIKRIIDEGYAAAEQKIDQHWREVDALAQALLKYETLSAEEARKILNGETLDKPSVSELLEGEANKPSKARAAETQPRGDADSRTAGGDGPIPSPA